MWLGETGVYVGALVSGVADVDAITLSMAELSRGNGSVSDSTAANAIVLAAASNTLVKGGLVWAISSAVDAQAGRPSGRRCRGRLGRPHVPHLIRLV